VAGSECRPVPYDDEECHSELAALIDPSSTAGACAITGAVVSGTGAGTCVVDADQAGNATYAAATQAQQSFAVSAPTAISAPAVARASLTPSTFHI
jgi:hypothetical protein